MTRAQWIVSVALALALIAPGSPQAWEAATTHAGLVERAALASQLHSRIELDLGVSGGLFARLVVPPADAPSLLALLKRFNPTHGYVPDGRGRQNAIGWLAAGAAVADTPTRFAGNHFLDPASERGLDRRTLNEISERSKHYVGPRRVGETLISGGKPAHRWVDDPANPLGHRGFIDQYYKAATTRTAGERERHLAGALVAAGAIVHVIQDLASPSHVRIDLRAHLDHLGKSRLDVGSRLERIAALAFGRLGVPAPREIPRKDRLSAFMLAPDGTGLAQVVSKRFYSRYTVPVVPRLPKGASMAAAGVAVRKALGTDDVRISASGRGFKVEDTSGTCIVLFEIEARDVTFYTEDTCVLSQLRALLPLAAGYGAGALDYLFRGKLAVKLSKGVSVASTTNLGDGSLELYWDNALGVRTRFFQSKVRGAIPAGLPAVPSGAKRVVAAYRGTDKLGEPLVAVGSALVSAQP